ncbi:hypothetical protein G9A89_020521 [Geosiphon pyriformis]|nr:hypothetical protein G9A89_020521 [Geosiphon pyriformis]
MSYRYQQNSAQQAELNEYNPSPNPQPLGPGEKFTDYPLWSTVVRKKNKVNLMRFNKDVNLKTFTPPVKLYRGDPNAPHPSTIGTSSASTNIGRGGNNSVITSGRSHGKGAQSVGTLQTSTGADTSLIAPYGGATRNKQMLFKKRTKQIYLASPESRKLKKEEDKPWILTDYDEKNTYIGEMEGGLRATYCLFIVTANGFKVIPVDRWYKFKSKIKHRVLSIEEAEEAMQKQQKKESRWMMRSLQSKPSEEDKLLEAEGGLYDSKTLLKTVESRDSDDEDMGRHKEEDDDEVDFELEFEDDEELAGDAKDDEEKEVEIKVKKSIRKATVKQEEEKDDSEEEEQEDLTTAGKDMKRLVRQLEDNEAYVSDEEDENPYISSLDEESEVEEVGGSPQRPPVNASTSKMPSLFAKGVTNPLKSKGAASTTGKKPKTTVTKSSKAASSSSDNTPKKPKTAQNAKTGSVTKANITNKKSSVVSTEIDSHKKSKAPSSGVKTISKSQSTSKSGAIATSGTGASSGSKSTVTIKQSQSSTSINSPTKRLRDEANQPAKKIKTEISSYPPDASLKQGKRSHDDRSTNDPAKKVKLTTKKSVVVSANTTSQTSSSTSQPQRPTDPITEAEVVGLISRGGMSTKDLIEVLRPKIKADSRNTKILLTLVKKVSAIDKNSPEGQSILRLRDGYVTR